MKTFMSSLWHLKHFLKSIINFVMVNNQNIYAKKPCLIKKILLNGNQSNELNRPLRIVFKRFPKHFKDDNLLLVVVVFF